MDQTVLDIFLQHDSFTAIALTDAVARNPFLPGSLGALGLFGVEPIRTTALTIEERQGQLRLIPFSERGTEGTQRTTELRKRRYFDVPRLMHDDTIQSKELQNIVQFGDTTVLMQLEQEVARRLSGPTGLLASVEYTKEFMRLAAIQGLCLNPGDSSVMYNWFDEFQIAQPTEVGFNLAANTAGSLRPIINDSIVRPMSRKAQGSFTDQTEIYSYCGDAFYDAFTNHIDVRQTFLNWSAAKDLRDGTQGAAFKSFYFAGVNWVNYRGSDDNTSIKIPTSQCKFFPVNAPGIFREAYAPGESMEMLNQPGKPVYVLPIADMQRRQWWKMEVYSYPLMICTRPEVLFSGRAGA